MLREHEQMSDGKRGGAATNLFHVCRKVFQIEANIGCLNATGRAGLYPSACMC